MPEILHRTLHSFSSEDPQFPARNLLETKVTKKWKCQDAGQKSCFVVLKLDKPQTISGIDIGNERSAFIEVFVGNSKQDPPVFMEILLATSFMTITEAKNELNPNRVRFFSNNILVESVAKQKWDLVKVVCTQPFNNKIKYGLSFITLHTKEEVKDNDVSPVKTVADAKKVEVDDSNEKKRKFGKFTIRGSDSDSDEDSKKKQDSSFNRWKSSKTGSQDSKNSIQQSIKTKIEENRKRIRVMTDSSDEEKPKEKPKPSRNRSSGLQYIDDDDGPNERLQKKIDRDRELKEKEQKTPKSLSQREKSPSRSDSKKSRFASFIDEDLPSTSSHSRDRSPSRSSKSSHSSSRDKKSTPKKSPRKDKDKETEKNPNTVKSPAKSVSYKPFHQLLQGVTFVFSGYVNPERGILRQKALDMGAKYKPDWDSSCTHLICAYTNTPKFQQVKGKGKIVSKRWFEACFTEQKKLSWRRYALESQEKDAPDSEEEIHNILTKPKSISTVASQSGSDDDMVVVDKRVKNGEVKKTEEKKEVSATPIEVEDEVKLIEEDLVVVTSEEPKLNQSSENVMDISTDDELTENGKNKSIDLTQCENQIFKGKSFFLNKDLSATDVIKLKNQIDSMMGRVTERASKADYIITQKGSHLPHGAPGEVLNRLWVEECYELGAVIPTTRYKIKPRPS